MLARASYKETLAFCDIDNFEELRELLFGFSGSNTLRSVWLCFLLVIYSGCYVNKECTICWDGLKRNKIVRNLVEWTVLKKLTKVISNSLSPPSLSCSGTCGGEFKVKKGKSIWFPITSKSQVSFTLNLCAWLCIHLWSKTKVVGIGWYREMKREPATRNNFGAFVNGLQSWFHASSS